MSKRNLSEQHKGSTKERQEMTTYRPIDQESDGPKRCTDEFLNSDGIWQVVGGENLICEFYPGYKYRRPVVESNAPAVKKVSRYAFEAAVRVCRGDDINFILNYARAIDEAVEAE